MVKFGLGALIPYLLLKSVLTEDSLVRRAVMCFANKQALCCVLSRGILMLLFVDCHLKCFGYMPWGICYHVLKKVFPILYFK